jgi:hypothetical protein
MAKYLKFKDDLTAGEDLLIEKDVIYPVVSESCSEYSFVDESECLHLYDKKLADFEVIELADFEVGQKWKVVKYLGYGGLNQLQEGDVITVTEVFDVSIDSPTYGEALSCKATTPTTCFQGLSGVFLFWTDIVDGFIELLENADD